MANNRSEKSCYQSRFGAGWIAAPQYLAENMCDRIARSKKQELPAFFWNKEKWKKTFLIQLRFANGLLKLYSIEAIIKALRTKEGKKVYSLGAKWLDPIIREQQEVVEKHAVAMQKRTEEIPIIENPTKPREPYQQKGSLASKLRDL